MKLSPEFEKLKRRMISKSYLTRDQIDLIITALEFCKENKKAFVRFVHMEYGFEPASFVDNNLHIVQKKMDNLISITGWETGINHDKT